MRIPKKKSVCLFVMMLLTAGLILSCVASKKKSFVNWALNLALHEELSPAQEAVVWTLSQTGQVSTYWIKNDVTGVLLTAERPGLSIPWGNALWSLSGGDPSDDADDTEGDNDFVEFEDLVSGDRFKIFLDEKARARGDRDGGDDDAGVSAEPAKPGKGSCEPEVIQSRPVPLVSVGPYLFLKWREKSTGCDEAVALEQERYIAVDLSRGEETDILTDEELEALRNKAEVKALGSNAEYTGTVPFYNPAFGLSFVHIFSSESTEVSDNGETRNFADGVQISDNTVPEKLKDFYLPPDLVQAFGLSLPDETLGGFVAVDGSAEDIEKMLKAFVDRP